jgi:hypothetical protein
VHEREFNHFNWSDGAVGWPYAFPNTEAYRLVYRAGLRSHRPIVVIHQYRHPLRAIEALESRQSRFGHSAICEANYGQVWQDSGMQEVDSPLLLAMKFYLSANTLAEAQQGQNYDLSFAVENIDEAWHRLSHVLKVPPEVPPQMLEGDRNSERQVEDYKALSWESLYAEDPEVAARIHSFAHMTGYE